MDFPQPIIKQDYDLLNIFRKESNLQKCNVLNYSFTMICFRTSSIIPILLLRALAIMLLMLR